MKPVLVDLPDVIETARLRLCPPKSGDGAIINAAIIESMDELKPWMPWAASPPKVSDTEEWARGAQASYVKREILPMTIWDKATGAFVGNSGLHDIDWEIPSFEIGYWLRTSYGGHGLMTEAVQGLTDFCVRTLHARRMQICMDDANVRSWRVAERCGYRLECLQRNARRNHLGALVHFRTYARTFDERGQEEHA